MSLLEVINRSENTAFHVPNIPAIMDSHLESKAEVWPVRSNRASMIGDDCLRKLVYYRLNWEMAQKINIRLLRVFKEGNSQESQIVIDLHQSLKGTDWEFLGQQQNISIPNTEISGKIDGFFLHKPTKKLVPVDIKTSSPLVFDGLDERVESLQKKSWTKKYLAQILLYMYANNTEYGMLLFKNKASGEFKQIVINLYDHLPYVESLLIKDGKIRVYIEKKEYPPRLKDQPEECLECPFLHICNPDIESEELIFATDEVLEKAIEEKNKIQIHYSRYQSLNKGINETIKEKYLEKGQTKVSLGKYLIEGKKVSRKAYQVAALDYWTSDIQEV